MIIHNCIQRSSEWFELRAGRVTGTRFKQMMMGKGTKTYKDLVLDLATEIITGGVTDQEFSYSSPIMERGADLEPIAREVFEDEVAPVKEAGFLTPENGKFKDWVGVSPDGLVGSSGLEIKCPLAKTHLNYLSVGLMPHEYWHQVQGSLYVSGLKSWYFMSYYPNMKPFIIEVAPDESLHEDYDKELQILTEFVTNKIEVYRSYGT